jgi:hypothetical protein
MNGFKNKFAKIKGISEVRRLPRLGKIRLGVKAVSQKTGNEYPQETDYFVCPDEVNKVYKKEFPDGHITELDVMFPINDPEVVFPQAYKFYGSSKGLKCIGNGETAMRFNEDKSGAEEIECPCELLEEGKCGRKGNLMVMLPKVSMGGIYQIDIGSFNSIVDINSGIDYVRHLAFEVLGVDRFALIPLKLKRVPTETHHEGKRQTHYTLRLYCNLNASEWNRIKGDFRIISPDERIALPPVEDINPKFDEGATVVEVDDEDTETINEPKEKDYLKWVEELLVEYYPGKSKTNSERKKELLKSYFGTSSWTEIKKMRLDVLKRSYEGMQKELEGSTGEDEDLPFNEDGSSKEEN